MTNNTVKTVKKLLSPAQVAHNRRIARLGGLAKSRKYGDRNFDYTSSKAHDVFTEIQKKKYPNPQSLLEWEVIGRIYDRLSEYNDTSADKYPLTIEVIPSSKVDVRALYGTQYHRDMAPYFIVGVPKGQPEIWKFGKTLPHVVIEPAESKDTFKRKFWEDRYNEHVEGLKRFEELLRKHGITSPV